MRKHELELGERDRDSRNVYGIEGEVNKMNDQIEIERANIEMLIEDKKRHEAEAQNINKDIKLYKTSGGRETDKVISIYIYIYICI